MGGDGFQKGQKFREKSEGSLMEGMANMAQNHEQANWGTPSPQKEVEGL